MKKIKYTVGAVQQDKLLELGLDLKDAYIISYLNDMRKWNNLLEKTVDGDKYMWVDYSKILTFLPALKIQSKDVLSRRFKKYEGLGLIKRHLHKNMVYGSYNFVFLTPEMNTLFEYNKIEDSHNEIEEMKKKLGLSGQCSSDTTQKSGGFDSKVASTTTQKSADNTLVKILPQTDSSSTNENPTAASGDDFFKNLKELLIKNKFKNYNSQTLKNIHKVSNSSLEEVQRVIEFMNKKGKPMKSNVLVAIIKDKDYLAQDEDIKKSYTRDEKIKHMLLLTSQEEIDSIIAKLTASYGYPNYETLSNVDQKIIDQDLGNILCKRFNKLKI